MLISLKKKKKILNQVKFAQIKKNLLAEQNSLVGLRSMKFPRIIVFKTCIG